MKKRVEQPDEIVDIAEEILGFNERTKTKLKVLTPDQMLNRLPITLAQLKAGNKSKKLKIRQLLYSLH